MRTTILALLVLGLAVPLVSAEDEVDPAAALLAKLTELRKAEDVGALSKIVAEVPEVYTDCENSGLKGKLRGELGKIVKDDDLGAARLAAVDALVGLDDPKAAWKEMKKALPSPKVEEADDLHLAVVKAAGKLAQSRAAKSLIELGFKAKDPKVAAAAALALGGFSEDKRGRVTILEELITIGRRTRPGRSTSKRVSKQARERWQMVAPAVIKGLNRLTRREMTSFEDWEQLWDDYKRKPKDLFVE